MISPEDKDRRAADNGRRPFIRHHECLVTLGELTVYIA
jgi:hypothetical protein